MRMKDKVALISGAAGGMGAATARLLAREGAKVVVADMLDAEGAAVVAEISKPAATPATSISTSPTSRVAVRRRRGREDRGRPRRAGEQCRHLRQRRPGPLRHRSLEPDHGDQLDRSVPRRQARQRRMKRRGRGGSVINISSDLRRRRPGQHPCRLQCLEGRRAAADQVGRRQHGRDDIRVNCVHPGLMPPMRTSGRTADPETRAKMLQGVPLGRAGEVDEVAYAILFLARTNRPTSPAPSCTSTAAGPPSSRPDKGPRPPPVGLARHGPRRGPVGHALIPSAAHERFPVGVIVIGPVAVGTRITARPPHRTRRAQLPHRAPTSGD